MVSWSLWLQGFLSAILSKEEVDITMFLDPAAEFRPGLLMVGNNMCTLRITEGLLGLTPLLGRDDATVVQAMACVNGFQDAARVPVHEALLAFEQAGRKVFWVFKQLVFNITNFIEVTVLQSFQDDGAAQRGAQGPEDLCVSAGRTRRHRMWRSARLALARAPRQSIKTR